MSSTDQFILFAIGCLTIGTLWRMSQGMTFGEALKRTIIVGSAPSRAILKTGHIAYKNRRRWW